MLHSYKEKYGKTHPPHWSKEGRGGRPWKLPIRREIAQQSPDAEPPLPPSWHRCLCRGILIGAPELKDGRPQLPKSHPRLHQHLQRAVIVAVNSQNLSTPPPPQALTPLTPRPPLGYPNRCADTNAREWPFPEGGGGSCPCSTLTVTNRCGVG